VAQKQIKAYSDLMTSPIDIGLPSPDFNELLELGYFMAESRPGLIVYVDNPPLQKWVDDE
jgi:hypothetical protein